MGADRVSTSKQSHDIRELFQLARVGIRFGVGGLERGCAHGDNGSVARSVLDGWVGGGAKAAHATRPTHWWRGDFFWTFSRLYVYRA